jgi:hypothetical protein
MRHDRIIEAREHPHADSSYMNKNQSRAPQSVFAPN